MNQYLLLRDNKQTGPYTAEQLAAKGIKPYDLVWQEGRSAAWRYPSEIAELKPFSPVVEEQPYDRFYKKPGDQVQATESASVAVAAQTVTEQQPVAAAGNTANAVQESQPVHKLAGQTTGKNIYVTMPASKVPTSATTPVAKKEETTKPVAQQYNQTATSTTIKSTEKKTAAASYIVSQEDDELNSSLLKEHKSRRKEDDEINNSFLNEYESKKAALTQQKSGGAAATTIKQAEKPAAVKKEIWSSPSKKDRIDWKALLAGSGKYLQDNKNLTRGLVAAVLILGGVVIGLVINSGHRQPDTKVLETLVKEIREQQSEKASTTGPATETVQNSNQPREEGHYNTDVPNNHPNNNITEPAPPASENNANQAVIRHDVIKKDNNVVPAPQNQNKSIVIQASNTNPQQVEATPAVMEPKEKPINQEVLDKARKNIYEQVRVEASAFKVGILGGVSDLDMTVLNSSLYTLDQVSVEIKYFGPEKKLVKTQTLIFNNVPPGKRRTLEVPRTSRGITIDYTVTSINSKALGLAQTGF
jgi:hypothetical protein